MNERGREDGYTLVETLAGLAVSLIIITAALSLLGAHRRMLQAQAQWSLGQMILDSAIEVVEGRLIFADHLRISGDPSLADAHVLACSREGYLLLDGELVFPKSFYQGFRLSCRAGPVGGRPDLLALSWTLSCPDGEICALGETRMELPNLSFSGGAIEIDMENADSQSGGLYFYFGFLEEDG